jgi:hypothetical protein
MGQGTPSYAWNASIIAAIAVSLLFLGINLYPILWPARYYNLDCPEMEDGGKILPAMNFEIARNQLAGFTPWARVRECKVTPLGRQFLLTGRMLPRI